MRPDVAYWKSDEKTSNLRWYRYLFLTHSKPSTHLRALLHVSRSDLAAIKGPIARLLERVGKAVNGT